jgi:hypothetical protein
LPCHGLRQVQVPREQAAARGEVEAEADHRQGSEIPSGTDEGDYKIKLRNLTRFLDEGDKCKVTLRFRGREMAHQEFGIRLIERVKNDLQEHSIVEQFPKMEGRQMVMVLSPKKVAVKPAAPAAKKEAVKEAAGKAASVKEASSKEAAKPAPAAVAAPAAAEVEKK